LDFWLWLSPEFSVSFSPFLSLLYILTTIFVDRLNSDRTPLKKSSPLLFPLFLTSSSPPLQGVERGPSTFVCRWVNGLLSSPLSALTYKRGEEGEGLPKKIVLFLGR